MTQEELDSMMNGEEIDNIDDAIEEDTAEQEESNQSFPPPPAPTPDHKVVFQLDENTAPASLRSFTLLATTCLSSLNPGIP